MLRYNCLIVDDEPPARAVLKRYVEKMPMLKLSGECCNAFEVISFLQSGSVDLIFLDIHMPQLTGMELLRTLTKPPKVIFTTAYETYALQSYDLDAVDYLLKPIEFERFVKAVNKALPSKVISSTTQQILGTDPLAATDAFLYFRVDRKMVKVVLKDIVFVESLKDYVKIATINELVITKNSMSAMEAMLPGDRFLRIHRSFMVSIEKIRSFSQSNIQLSEVELPIGKLYQREVLKILQS